MADIELEGIDAVAEQEALDTRAKQEENAKRLRTPLMVFLLFMVEVLVHACLGVTVTWFNRRGAYSPSTLFAVSEDRHPKNVCNLHGLTMILVYTYFIPQETIAEIFFEDLQTEMKLVLISCIKFFGLVTFIIGMSDFARTKQILLPTDGPDRGIHKCIAIHLIIFYFALQVIYILKLIAYIQRILMRFPTLSRLLRQLSNRHIEDTVFTVMQLLSLMSLLSGISSYIVLMVNSEFYSIAHIFDPYTTHNNAGDEPHVRGIIACIVMLFLVGHAVWYYRHDIMYHTGIITYEIYHKHFLQLCKGLENVDLKDDGQQDFAAGLVADIEKMNKFGAPQIDDEDIKRRSLHTRNYEEEKMEQADAYGLTRTRNRSIDGVKLPSELREDFEQRLRSDDRSPVRNIRQKSDPSLRDESRFTAAHRIRRDNNIAGAPANLPTTGPNTRNSDARAPTAVTAHDLSKIEGTRKSLV